MLKLNSDTLQQILTDLNADRRLVVAYSGGLDSHVLLHALAQLRSVKPKITIRAIHIDHGLNPNSRLWSKHCKKICRDLDIPLVIKKINAKKASNSGHSQEALARDLRYQALKKLLRKDENLLTAHHADDQAETILLQLFRGAGPKGLSAIPAVASLGTAILIRPLLSFSRKDLKAYAKKNKLVWVDDDSNFSCDIDRNYVRQKIMPVIKTRWKGVLKTLARSSKHCQEASVLLDDLAKFDIGDESKPHLAVEKLLSLSAARQRNALRYWLRSLHLSIPNTAKLKQIQTDVLLSRHDAAPLVAWEGVEIRRYENNIYAMTPIPKLPSNLKLPWRDTKKPLKLPLGLGTLHFTDIDKNWIYAAKKRNAKHDKISIRFRKGGEKIRLPNRQGTHELKKLFQEYRIPPWQRNLIPLIYSGEELIAIVLPNSASTKT